MDRVPFGSSVSPNVAINRTTQLSPTADTVCDKTIDATRATTVGKSNDLSGKKSIEDPTSNDERNVELYISDTVPASPTPANHRPTTRLRSRVASMVIPEPVTDIPSESDSSSKENKQGRPAGGGTATARA